MRYSEFVSRYTPKRSRGGGGRVELDPATALHDLATKLFDQGDGHGADWAAASEALFRCAFAFLRHIPSDDTRGATIARRALDAATSLVAGSEDSNTAYTALTAKPLRPVFTMTDPAPNRDHKRP